MALNSLQVKVPRLLAERRKRSGESYVAGGVALNYALEARQDGSPYSELPDRLVQDLTLGGTIRFHKGRIGGVWPVIVA